MYDCWVVRAHTYTNQYHLHSFFPDGCLPVLTVLRVSHQERRSVSVTGRCGVVRARAHQHSPCTLTYFRVGWTGMYVAPPSATLTRLSALLFWICWQTRCDGTVLEPYFIGWTRPNLSALGTFQRSIAIAWNSRVHTEEAPPQRSLGGARTLYSLSFSTRARTEFRALAHWTNWTICTDWMSDFISRRKDELSRWMWPSTKRTRTTHSRQKMPITATCFR